MMTRIKQEEECSTHGMLTIILNLKEFFSAKTRRRILHTWDAEEKRAVPITPEEVAMYSLWVKIRAAYDIANDYSYEDESLGYLRGLKDASEIIWNSISPDSADLIKKSIDYGRKSFSYDLLKKLTEEIDSSSLDEGSKHFLEFMIANAILADASEIEYKEPYEAYENGRKEGSESFLWYVNRNGSAISSRIREIIESLS
jgi:hypothetical protein